MADYLESFLEAKCCKWALARGVKNFKIVAQTAFPDRIFYKAGRILYIEFKVPGAKLRKLQAHVHELLREEGFVVETIWTIEEFKPLILSFFNLPEDGT